MLGLLDALKLERVAVVGFSQGGMIGLYMAVLAPERISSLVTIGAQAYYSREIRAWVVAQGPDSANATRMANSTRVHGAEKAMRLARQFWHFRLMDGDPALTPDRLARVTAATLVIHGDHDFVPVSQAWYIYTAIPNAHLWIVPHAGHWPFSAPVRPEAWRVLVGFLSDAWQERR